METELFVTVDFWAWVVSVILAALYLMAGGMKAFRPIPDLAKMMGWPADVGPGLVRFIGYAELAGAAGLILPLLTGILTFLTPLAALGLSIVQVLAIPLHLRRNEAKILPMNVVLLAMSLFVLWARIGLLGL